MSKIYKGRNRDMWPTPILRTTTQLASSFRVCRLPSGSASLCHLDKPCQEPTNGNGVVSCGSRETGRGQEEPGDEVRERSIKTHFNGTPDERIPYCVWLGEAPCGQLENRTERSPRNPIRHMHELPVYFSAIKWRALGSGVSHGDLSWVSLE